MTRVRDVIDVIVQKKTLIFLFHEFSIYSNIYISYRSYKNAQFEIEIKFHSRAICFLKKIKFSALGARSLCRNMHEVNSFSLNYYMYKFLLLVSYLVRVSTFQKVFFWKNR